MKTQKVITIITVILFVAIISLASFVGIYKKEEYRVSNIVKDYTLGMQFTDSRLINFEVNKEENAEELLILDNYKQTESIIKNRLKNLGVDEYRVVLDETTGNIQVRIPENEDTDTIIYYLLQSGTFELKDGETEETLIDTNNVDKANVVYSQGETETGIYLQIKFNKEGQQKLEEISKVYVSTTSEITNDEGEIEKVTETKKVKLYLNGEPVTETYFGDTIKDGTLNIIIGESSDSAVLEQYRIVAEENKTVLNSGVLPITYTETDVVEPSSITEQQTKLGIYIALGVLAVMIIIFGITLRVKGILAAILQIGYIALLLLALRYTNVKITIEGVCGIVLASIINFVYIYKAFKHADLNFVKEITAKFALKLIPVYIIAVILSFNRMANIYSLGMTLVWGIIVMYLYNLTLTQITLKTIKK